MQPATVQTLPIVALKLLLHHFRINGRRFVFVIYVYLVPLYIRVNRPCYGCASFGKGDSWDFATRETDRIPPCISYYTFRPSLQIEYLLGKVIQMNQLDATMIY